MTVMTTERTAAPAPVAATVRQGVGALSLSAMSPAEVWGFCERLANTPLLPDQYRKQPSSVLWAMEYGRALGLDVVTTINTIHVIKGKPTQSADLMLSRARGAGHRVRVQQGNGECTVSIWRSDDAEFENRVSFSVQDAVTAQLCQIRDNRTWARDKDGKPTSWEKWPRNMLRARAIAECVRQACPEVLHGAIYTPEELGAVIDQEGNPVLDVPPTFQQQAPRAEDQWQQPAPVQQTPPDVVAAGAADVPPESLTPAGRDYLHEAMAAPDAATVRLIWTDARDEGARDEYLKQIAEVGKGKAAAEQQPAAEPIEHPAQSDAPDPVPPMPETLPGAPASEPDRLTVLGELYRAGEAAGLTQVETRGVLSKETGRTIADATADDLARVAADLRAAAGGAR